MEDIILTKPQSAPDWLRLRRLYVRAFPRAERKPFSIIVSMSRKGKSDVLCIRRNGKLVGLAFTVNAPERILLDYLAVAPQCRGRGVGSRAMEALLERYSDKGLFVEIESTRQPCPDLQLRLRRRQFYQRCGMTPMEVYADVFGVPMELLGKNCCLTFEEYKGFYRDHYSPFAAEHVLPADQKEESP